MRHITNVQQVIKRMQKHFGGPVSRSRRMVIRNLEEISKECKDHADTSEVDRACIKVLTEHGLAQLNKEASERKEAVLESQVTQQERKKVTKKKVVRRKKKKKTSS